MRWNDHVVTVEITADATKFREAMQNVALTLIDVEDRRRVLMFDTVELLAKKFQADLDAIANTLRKDPA